MYTTDSEFFFVNTIFINYCSWNYLPDFEILGLEYWIFSWHFWIIKLGQTCLSLQYKKMCFKASKHTFKGNYLLFSFLLPFSVGSTLKKKKNLNPRCKFFTLKIDPILERLCLPGKQIVSEKVMPLEKICRRNSSVQNHHSE